MGKTVKKLKASTKDAISETEWVAIYRSQKGLCAICEKPLRNRYDMLSHGETAAVDHCHAREKQLKKAGVAPVDAIRRSIRALLCAYECNHQAFTKYWSDHPERLVRAHKVATEFPAQLFISAIRPLLVPVSFESKLC